MTKVCSVCKIEKPLEEFSKDKRKKSGRGSWCKLCTNIHHKKYRSEHKEEEIAYRKANAERFKSYWHEYSKKWRTKNRAYYLNYKKEYYKNNKEKHLEYDKKWKKEHPDNVKIYCDKSNKKRISHPKGKLNNSIRVGIYDSLQKGSKSNRHWEELVGYTLEQLQKHIEKQFVVGMTWENYGKHGWHIDHIIPISAFNFETPEDIDFRRCWSLNNLRPLWATDNLKKHDKLIKPFQPSLMIAA